MNVTELLKQIFGYDRFHKGQREVIEAILEKRDAVAIMPTGSGKSLCFQLPALMHKGMSIVISPLISLMKDQYRALAEYGVSAAFVNSTLSYQQTNRVLRSAMAGKYRLLYVAPERLNSEAFISFSLKADIAMIAIDEAHCVSQWGHNFRPSYIKIVEYIEKLSKRPVIAAFTATATQKVKQDIIDLLGQKDPLVVSTGFDRENLYFEVRKPKDKVAELLKIVGKDAEQSGIVYCSTRKTVEEVCFRLHSMGYSSTRYHAGLEDEERKTNQEDFLFDRKKIMVATNAFGMGIDKSNVSFVVHYNMPKDIESYYQEAGRAGRDGSKARCILLFSKRDVVTMQYLIDMNKHEELDQSQKEEVLEHDYSRLRKMTFYCNTTECLRDYILDYFGDDKREGCANCGNCLMHYEEVDVTIEAQKILSCVFKTRQRYGVVTIIDILRGSKAQKILRLGLEGNSTYAIMRGVSENKIRLIINFLVLSEYLLMTDCKYPTLKLGAKARRVLKDDCRVVMKLPKDIDFQQQQRSSKKSGLNQDVDENLYELLREQRLRIANEKDVPAFVVFSNATLIDMCIKQPKSKEEFIEVSGIGEHKAKLYAKHFIPIIKKNA